MIFQDPMTSLNPVLTIGRQIRGGSADALRSGQGRGEQARRRLARPGRDPERREPPQGLPAPVLGRHAPARDDRDGARLRAQAPDRRRAHDRARRHDPGADPRPPARSSSHDRETALILITHDLGVVAGMCERVNVMYGGMFMETGTRRPDLRSPAPPVHARSPAVRSRASTRPGRRASAPDPRRAARHAAARRSACPFQPRCRFEVEQSRLEGAAAPRDRAGSHGRLLQPGACGGVAEDEGGRGWLRS